MKYYITGWYHRKNLSFLNYFCQSRVNNINEADIIISGSGYIPNHNYPNKIFIFGPHFAVFPDNLNFDNTHKNGIYIQASEWVVEVWKELHFDKLPLYSIPFGVDTDRFTPQGGSNVLVYFKHRKREELAFVESFLQRKKYTCYTGKVENESSHTYKIFNYNTKYNEEDYLNYLRTCQFGIWIGGHETQGFALQEAMSCNIPLLVWDVKLMKQEVGYENVYSHIKTRATTIPYWDKRCGMFFYTEEELEETFNLFISNLDNFKPREYVLENLSYQACKEKWDNLIKSLINK